MIAPNLPQWKCHKVVRAAKIASIEQGTVVDKAKFPNGSWVLNLETDCLLTHHEVAHEWFTKHQPEAGGYFVQYGDGYGSYSPADAFEPGYAPLTAEMDFGDALRALKGGRRVARAGWNGKDMWLSLSSQTTFECPAERFWSPHNRTHAEAQGGFAKVLPSITMKTATGEILMGWLASQTDMLASDWVVVE